MLSLRTLLAIKPQTLYPGHGTHIPGPEASTKHIQAYITHRQVREDQIIALLTSISVDQAGPGGLVTRVKEFLARKKEDEAKAIKEKKELMTGKPYVDKTKEVAKVGWGAGGEIRQIIHRGKPVGEGEEGKSEDEDEKELQAENKAKDADEEKKVEDIEVDARHEAFDSQAISLALLTRLMYDTTSEKLIFAAQRPVLAHLQKLEQDKRVRKVTVMLPKIEEMVVGKEKEAVEGWEIVLPDLE
jgi:ribonuclease/clavin/mitogillin